MKKLFLSRFKQVMVTFASSIKGIADETLRHNYASLVLDRLLVLFFLQHHGLLDNNSRYLQHHLDMMHTAEADTFFAAFLLPLCHTILSALPLDSLGFGVSTFPPGRRRESMSFLDPLEGTEISGQTISGTCDPSFGHVPVLAHPLFQKHDTEDTYQPQIPDESFYKLFLFLEEFCWELTPRTYLVSVPSSGSRKDIDSRRLPGGKVDTPNPNESSGSALRTERAHGTGLAAARRAYPALHHDIFADLLEQRSNQKQTGTYYTTDDVTDYFANNTILPTLFHRLQKRCPAIMHPSSTIWQHLIHTPDRYIPDALQHPAYLPKETTQEYQLRQQHLTNLVSLLRQGTIQTINAMVTYNLAILRFTVDVISTHQDLELLVTLFTELEQLTILDPTCGSGAFLYAALTTLQTLYMTCLQRMQVLLAVGMRTGASPVPTPPLPRACPVPTTTPTTEGTALPTDKKDSLARAQSILKQISAAPNISYFVVHHIIAHNLYGVDLMDEATRVCTLRLYLTLLAQTQRIEDVPPLHQVPIQIKTGNALVGDVYSTREKMTLIKDTSSLGYRKNEAFHWHLAFPEVAQLGGFAVILGNPPYIEHSKVRSLYAIDGYEEKSCGNLYAAMLERSLALLHPDGSSIGLLLPMSICGSQRFAQLRALLTQSLSPIWLANFDIFPGRLFGSAFQRLSILLGRRNGQEEQAPSLRGRYLEEGDCRRGVGLSPPKDSGTRRRAGTSPRPYDNQISTLERQALSLQTDLYTTRIHRWYPEERPFIIDLLRYTPSSQTTTHTSLQQLPVFPKLASTLHAEILQKIAVRSNGYTIATVEQGHKTPYFVYYQEATNYWIKAVCHVPFYKKNGMTMAPPHGRFLFFHDEQTAHIIMALMNSSLFYLWFTTYSDGFHLAHALVTSFPCDQELLDGSQPHSYNSLSYMASILEADLLAHTRLSTRNKGARSTQGTTPTAGESGPKDRHTIELTEYQVSYSKQIIDEIDRLLASYYAFTKDETDFIINYDKKYRMRRRHS